jgi:hypothetical protein
MSVAMATLMSLSVAADIARDGLKAYWQFSETTGTTVSDTTHTNPGTLLLGATFATGKIGGGVAFDGAASYIDCGIHAEMAVSTALSIVAWVKAEPQTHYAAIVARCNGKAAEPKNIAYLFDIVPTGQVRGYVSDGTNYQRITSKQKVNDGSWHHVVFVLGSSKLSIFVDGKSDQTPINRTLTPQPALSSDFHVFIGDAMLSQPAWTFKGTIDELRVYSRALTDAEVAQLYSEGKSVSAAPLAAVALLAGASAYSFQ